MKHIVPISGKDSWATAVMLMYQHPEIEYEYVFNPVGLELPETLEWLTKVEGYLGKEIIRIGVDLTTLPEWINGFRPSHGARYCTRKGKIVPLEEYFDGEGYVYYGLRADEPERIGYINKGKSTLTPVYPLRELNMGIQEVLQVCHMTGLKPPVYQWEYLKQEFTRLLGEDFIYSNLKEWEIDYLFAWRIRNNCYRCYFMRRYEWIGLHDHHPELFWQVVADEEDLKQREKPFTVIKGVSLRELLDRREDVLERHVKSTVKILEKSKQKRLFDGEMFADMLSMTSCGLFCGK